MVKEHACQFKRSKKCGLDFWTGKIPWRRKWQLQYSCLEKPMDRGAWWATIHMVVQSDTTEVIQHACMYNITFYLLNNLSIYLSIYIYIYLILSLSIHLLMDISAVYREWRFRRSQSNITKYQLYKVS